MITSLRGNAQRLSTIQRLAFPLGAVTAALYASRIGAEFFLPRVPLTGAILGLLAGGVVAWWLRPWSPVLPLLLLLPYTVFPFQSPELALLCATLAVITGLSHRYMWDSPRLDLGVFAAGLAIYGLTLAPGIQPADGGEFQLVIAEWGVAHPPGYPLYTLLGGLFTRLLPVGEFVWRVNLFSAATGALTLAVVARAIRLETRSGWAALIGAGVLGSASAFWTTSTQASIRPMTALFMALMLAAALAYRRAVAEHNARGERHALLLFGMAAGFGVTHHASLIFAGSVMALMIVTAAPRLILAPRQWGPALGGAFVGATPWVYLLVRGAAGARLAPPTLTSWDGFWQHVLATGFAGDMFYYRTASAILERLGLLLETLRVQWHWGVFLIGLVAFGLLLWRKSWHALALGGAFAIHAIITATYRAPQTVEYMLPAYVCLAVLVGLGAGQLTLPHRLMPWRGAIIALAMVFILWSAWPVWISLRAYQQHDPTTAQAREALQAAPANSTLLANWHHATPLWVAQATERLRPDVLVRYVAPQGSEPILDTWTNAVRAAAAPSPALITCSYYPESFRHTGLTFSASGPCWQATAATTPAPDATPLATFEAIALLDARTATAAAAGERLAADLAWYLPEAVLYGQPTAFLHLVDDGDVVMAQVDDPILAASPAPGLVRQRLTLRLPRTLQPGTYRLLAGLYHPSADGPQPIYSDAGSVRIAIATLEILPSGIPPITRHPMHSPLDAGLRLAGVDYDLSVPGRARLYLHWQLSASSARTRWDVIISHEGQGLAQDFLQGSATAGFITTVYDIPDTAAAQGVRVAVTQDDQQLAVRGAWQLPVQPAIALPPVRPGSRYIPVGDAIITDYSIEPAGPEAESVRLHITLASTQPQIQDIMLKAVSTAGLAEVPPLNGMLPSLKWGWRTTFTATLDIPVPQDHTSAAIRLTLYDAFTSEAWPVFDPALSDGATTLLLIP